MSEAYAQAGANDNPNDNATWLFIQPSSHFHKSEPWWSALFSILVLHLAQGRGNSKIPVRKCVGSPDEHFDNQGAYLDCSEIKFNDVLVDAKLNQRLFPGIPNKFRDLRPDIMIHRPKLKRITFIENKTVGAKLGKQQLDRYHEVKEHLSKEGWSVEFFLLISSGYDSRSEWRAVEKTQTKLILWEDVLRIMDSIEFFRSIIGVSLKPYYEKWA